MAANDDDDPISLDCKLCEKNYQHKNGPLMLPCLHSFCRPCLEHLVEKENSGTKIECPTCHTPAPIPNEGIQALPLNLRLSHLAKESLYKDKIEAGGKVGCQKCESEEVKKATTFCCYCCEFLCKRCQHEHQKFLRDEQHAFIELESYKKAEFKIQPPPAKCPQHRGQDLTVFCLACEKLICLLCAQVTHKNHEQNYPEQVAQCQHKEFEEHISTIQDALNVLQDTIKEIHEKRRSVEAEAKEAKGRIKQMSLTLKKAVEDREARLQARSKLIADEKDDVLSNQLREFERLRSELSYAQLHAVDAIKNHSSEEILSVKKSIKLRLERTLKVYERQSMALRENEIINTSLEIDSLIKQIEAIGFFPSVPDSSKCCIEGLAVPTAIVGKERKIAVVLRDENEKPVKGQVCIQHHLTKVGEDPDEYIPPKVTVAQSNNDDGVATLSFTPDQPGEYEVTVMVRNKPFDPFVITAHAPKNYGNFHGVEVSTTKTVGGATYGIAVNTKGTIFVSNLGGNTVKVFRPDGTEGQIGSSANNDGGLSNPRGLVILNDSLYVVSSGNHTIKKFSINDEKFTKSFGVNGSGEGQFSNPYGICTDGKGRLLVADYSNKRIQVLTSDGEFITSYNCTNYPWDVAVDPVGNVHVALRDNHHIAVYTPPQTDPVTTYNLGGTLQYPTGIYIDGEGNRLISAYNANKVHIADVNNQLISTRNVNYVFMSTMDYTGAVLLSEHNSNRISILYQN